MTLATRSIDGCRDASWVCVFLLPSNKDEDEAAAAAFTDAVKKNVLNVVNSQRRIAVNK